MIFSKSKLPINWPSPLHNKCSQGNCMYPNLPQPAPGTYVCVGCRKGTYVVTMSMAVEVEAQSRRAYEFRQQKRERYQAIQETSERRSEERDYARYDREGKTAARREKWGNTPGSPLERSAATRRLGSPVARPPLRSTPAMVSPPGLVVPPGYTSSKSKSQSKESKRPKPLKLSNSASTPSPAKHAPSRPFSPKNLYATVIGKTPVPVRNPYNCNPNWQAEADAALAVKRDPNCLPPPRPVPPRPLDLCSRNCPIHSKPKEKKADASSRPQGPVRPPRPPTVALSVHSTDDDAFYYSEKAQMELRGYMPRPYNGGRF